MNVRYLFAACGATLMLVSCGGGGGSSSQPAVIPNVTAAPTTAASPGATPSVSSSPTGFAGFGNPTPTAAASTAKPIVGGAGASPTPSGPPVAVATATPQPSSMFSTATPVYYNAGEADNSGSSVVGLAGTIVSPKAEIDSNGTTSGLCSKPFLDNLYTSYLMDVTDTHFHTHLSIFVNGTQVALPAGIGFVGNLVSPSIYQVAGENTTGFYAGGQSSNAQAEACTIALHTHTQSGIIHVEDDEAPIPSTGLPSDGTTFSLGQFFDVWEYPQEASNPLATGTYVDPVTFLDAQLGLAAGTQPTAVYVSSNWYDPNATVATYSGAQLASIPLLPDQEITIEFGMTVPIPRYQFDAALCANEQGGAADSVCPALASGSPYPGTNSTGHLTTQSRFRGL